MKIFFDLDGTLIDVSGRHYRVYSEIVTEFDGEPMDRAKYWQLKRSKTPWSELLGKSKLNPDILDNFLEKFIGKIESPDYLQADTLLPGALETLQRTAKQQECYLVSLRRSKENLLGELDHLDIRKYFQKVLSAHSETDGSDKKVELIRQELKDDEQAVIVGDTEADIKTGKELGVTTVAVLSGIRDKSFLLALQPDYIIEDIGKLTELNLQ